MSEIITQPRVRLFNAFVERVVAPNVLEVYVGLGMGVCILKRVTIDHAPSVPRPNRQVIGIGVADTFPVSYGIAVRCLIVLCGGKRVRVETDETQNDFLITARVGVRARNPPDGTTWKLGDVSLLDVGAFLQRMATDDTYDVSAMKTALNGPQRH